MTWLMPAQVEVEGLPVGERAPAPVDDAGDFPKIEAALKPEAAPRPVPKARSPVAATPSQVPVAAPVAAPAPAAAPEAPTSYSLAFAEGSVAVELRRGAEVHRLPSKVAVGEWNVFARFNGRDFVAAGTAEAVPEKKLVVSCNEVFLQCRSK